MALDPREVVHLNRASAAKMVEKLGVARTTALLKNAAEDLSGKLSSTMGGDRTFTRAQAESTLAQVKMILGDLTGGMERNILGVGQDLAEQAAGDTIDYMERADAEFRGTGAKPLNLDEALVFDRAVQGSRASILSRLLGKKPKDEKKTGDAPKPTKEEEGTKKQKGGILSRYTEASIGHFEEVLQHGILTGKSTMEMRDKLREKSPFLAGAPKSWAERIVRTELMGAYGRGSWEAGREADEQTDDIVKILSSIFDDRTGADSYAVHGQIRRPDEPFETWFGLVQHPPDRPNDRGVVVNYRIAWKLQPYLTAKSPAEIAARWKQEKRKGKHPPQPRVTTVPLSRFGNG